MKRSKLYTLWCAIKSRCFNKNLKTYKYYGGRNITLYKLWENNFSLFKDYVSSLENYDASNICRTGITLDRIDCDKNYEPGNLRWVNMELQSRNRRKKKNSKSKYIGVSEDKSGIRIKKWSARITINKKTIRIGRYATQEEAKNARDKYISDNKLENFMLNN
jgi:hypothetical protein